MATATFTEVVNRDLDDEITEAIWDDQVRDNVNQLAGAHRNLLVDGGFELWQRGAGPYTAVGGSYNCEQWHYADPGMSGSIAITREATTKLGASSYSLKAVYTRVGVNSKLQQRLEWFVQLRGRYLSLSVWVHQSVASGCRPFIADSAGTTYGSAVATTGSFVLLTVTRTIDGGATEVAAGVEFQASGTYYFDNAMLSLSPVAAPYRPLLPGEELRRAQRHYELIGAEMLAVATAAGQLFGVSIPFKVDKGGTPTATKNGTWVANNCNQPTVLLRPGHEHRAATLYVTSAAAGQVQFYSNASGQNVSVEWNP